MIPILYEDDEILVLDKPCGLAVQPGAGVSASAVDLLESQLAYRPRLVHRLDKETAGCLVVAKSAAAAAKWTALIGSKAVSKYYRAVVKGGPQGERGVLDAAIEVRGEEKTARTAFRVVGREGDYCQLELKLETGRMHQIRLHLAGQGWPVLGDDRHGDFALNKALKRDRGLKRLMLWSRALVLPLVPSLTIRSSMPEHFRAFFQAFPGLEPGLARGGEER